MSDKFPKKKGKIVKSLYAQFSLAIIQIRSTITAPHRFDVSYVLTGVRV